MAVNDVDIVIVGAGVMGSTLATLLGRDGHSILVIDKDLGYNPTFSGEGLLPFVEVQLKKFGLADILDEIKCNRSRGIYLGPADYREEGTKFDMDEIAIRYGRFVNALRDRARQTTGVQILEGQVTTLLEEKGRIAGVRYKLSNEENEQEVTSRLVICADGLMSKFGKRFSRTRLEKESSVVVLQLEDAQMKNNDYFNILSDRDHNIGLIIYQPDCEDKNKRYYRYAVDIPRHISYPKNMQEYLKSLEPYMPDFVREAYLKAVASKIYQLHTTYTKPADPIITPGVMLAGESLQARSYWTAPGVSLILHDVEHIRKMLNETPLRDDKAIGRGIRQWMNKRLKYAAGMSANSTVQYHITLSPDKHIAMYAMYLPEFATRWTFVDSMMKQIMSGFSCTPYEYTRFYGLSIMYACWRVMSSRYFNPLALYDALAIWVKVHKLCLGYLWRELWPYIRGF